jgi:hypothetical protein
MRGAWGERGRVPGGDETGRRMRKRITLSGANQGARRALLWKKLLRAPFAWLTNGGVKEARTSVAQAEISFEDRLLQASKAAAPRVKMRDSMDRRKRKSTLPNPMRGKSAGDARTERFAPGTTRRNLSTRRRAAGGDACAQRRRRRLACVAANVATTIRPNSSTESHRGQMLELQFDAGPGRSHRREIAAIRMPFAASSHSPG